MNQSVYSLVRRRPIQRSTIHVNTHGQLVDYSLAEPIAEVRHWLTIAGIIAVSAVLAVVMVVGTAQLILPVSWLEACHINLL